MLTLFGDSYQRYMDRTGMFLPRKLEAPFSAPLGIFQSNAMKYAAIIVCLPVLVIGSGVVLRQVTLSSLPYQAKNNVTLVSILPEDDVHASKAIDQLFAAGNADKLPLFKSDRDYLGYVMPPDYVMQGMIANTGDEFHLHKQDHTFALIADWVMNPFEHLRRSPSAQMAAMRGVDPRMARRHHCPLGVNDQKLACESCPYKRIIFLEADGMNGHLSKEQLLSLDVVRVPVGFIDINTQTGEIINAMKVERATAWKDVPTPSI